MPPDVRVLQATEADELSSDDVAVVVDVLRATTTMCVLLFHGARRVVPVLTPEDALREAPRLHDPVLFGERERSALEGFIDNSPAKAASTAVAGRDAVLTTTNGTRVLLDCRRAGTVVAGALVNATALSNAFQDAKSVAVVACGWKGTPSEDDNAAAVFLADAIAGARPDPARAVAGVEESVSAVKLSQHGKRADVELALQVDAFPVVPVLRGPALERL